MRRTDFLVEVRDRTLARVGTITPKYLTLKATLRHIAVGEWELTLPGDHPMVPYLSAPGSGIIVTLRSGKRFSGPTSHPKRKRDLQNPDGTYTFTGRTDTQLLADARAYPDPTTADLAAQQQANDTRTADAESLMRQYVHANIAASGAPAGRIAGFRQYLRLEGSNQLRGPIITKSPRFQNLLELLTEIATLGGLGFHVVQRGLDLVFEVLDVADRSDLVRLDIENGTLTSEEVEQSGPSVTRVIVAGQGEGTERVIIQRTTAEAAAAEIDWGRVIEDFTDQRNAAELVELQQAGDERLIEGGSPATNVKVVAADDQTMRYAIDWEEGDIVAVIVSGQETRTVVTAATMLVGADFVGVGAAIGDPIGFDSNAALTKRVDDIDQRVEKIERTHEGGSGGIAVGAIIGQIIDWPSNILPPASDGVYSWANGAEVSRETYADLYARLGGAASPWGQGNGSTTFNLPNRMNGRTPVGRLDSDPDFDTLGKTGGEKEHELTVAELASHTHTQNPHSHGVSDPGHNHSQNAHGHGVSNANVAAPGHEHALGSDGYAKIAGNDSADYMGIQHTGAVDGTWQATYRTSGGTVLLSSTTYSDGAALGGTTQANTSTVNVGVNNATATNNPSGTGVGVNSATAVNQNAGGGDAHNNMPPFQVVNYIIRLA